MSRLSAPIFRIGDDQPLTQDDSYTRPDAPGGQFALAGPSIEVEEGHLPVRGDLAHIRLAGRFFVPHYAVPMPHLVTGSGAALRAKADAAADEVCDAPEGTTFNVLDIAGGWAWGQIGEDGFVGYLPMTSLALP